MRSDYHPAYYDGMVAAIDDRPESDCPYGFVAAESESPVKDRENSQLCRRMWWLAGWHEARRTR